jgi:hypothetical protein
MCQGLKERERRLGSLLDKMHVAFVEKKRRPQKKECPDFVKWLMKKVIDEITFVDLVFPTSLTWRHRLS